MDVELMLRNGNYVYARSRQQVGDSGRSKRWRQMLMFPNIAECGGLERFLESIGGLTFQSIIRQPIGMLCHSVSLGSKRRKKGVAGDLELLRKEA